MKKKSIWKKPCFSFALLALAVLCFAVCAFLPEYSYLQRNGHVQFYNPESFCTSEDGRNAVVDDGKFLYCMNENGELIFALDVLQFPYPEAEIVDVTFGLGGNLFCHIAAYNESARLTDAESVWEISSDGKIIREIVHYDYKNSANPPSRQVMIGGLHTSDERLCYLYEAENEKRVVAVNPDNLQQTERALTASEGFADIVRCHAMPGEGFLVLKNNGEIGKILYDGAYEFFYKAEYDAVREEGLFLQDVCMIEEQIYLLAGQEDSGLYRWESGEWRLLSDASERIRLDKEVNLYGYGLGEYEKRPAIHMNEQLYLLDGGDTPVLYETKVSLPGDVVCAMFLRDVLPAAGFLFLLCSTIFGIGCLMKWRFSILSKQLLSTIPVVVLMLLVVIISMFVSMIHLNTDDILRETIAINEIAAAQFDAEELDSITGYDSVDSGYIKQLGNKLRMFVNGNRSDWSSNYSMALYVRTVGEKFVCVADSEESGQFMTSSFASETPIHEDFYEKSNTLAASVSLGEDWENLHLILVSPIYRTDGSYDAFVLLSASQNRLIEAIVDTGKNVLFLAVFWIVLLILLISFVSARNVKSLRKAKDVVAKIAGGDFSMRVNCYSQDETGEICAGVNDMADRLEQYIKEKERNEKFYYKFVPEKFRELLHKEEFTDLALGDAQSADLSILFCDIRAFSLNSEMMTARESFDFVNRIYGKAGPIIRKHNGFIDKYIGDAVMALFESADDAVAAGVELYRAIVFSPDAEKEFGIPSVKVGIGIHSGMARIGIVGEEERMSGTVISNTVNLSSRMEALTKKYGAGMIISKDTLDRMKNPDALSTRYLGMVQVAGVNEVAGLYEVLDCLDEDIRKKREQSRMQFSRAVRAFHSGEAENSLEMFRKLSGPDAEDKAAQLYASHIEDKIRRGDTEHNVFRFKRKE